MDFDINTLRVTVTLVSFALYVGIVAWAWSKSKAVDFKQAQQLPFESD